MKSILVSKKPKIVANALNEKASILIFKKFPKDFKGLVYIYTTREYGKTLIKENCMFEIANVTSIPSHTKVIRNGKSYEPYNGKVVARFYCNKVEEIPNRINSVYTYPHTQTLIDDELLDMSCLSTKELENYLGNKNGYAIHISQLEIFDKPKELSEFYGIETYYNPMPSWKPKVINGSYHIPLTKAPKNYCYVEV